MVDNNNEVKMLEEGSHGKGKYKNFKIEGRLKELEDE